MTREEQLMLLSEVVGYLKCVSDMKDPDIVWNVDRVVVDLQRLRAVIAAQEGEQEDATSATER